MVTVAAGLFTVSVLSLAATVVMFTQTERVSIERAPRTVQEKSSATFEFSIEHLIVDGLPAQLVYLDPLSDDAPLPPGLSEWPEPGELVLSEALREIWDVAGLVPVGTIASSGIASPDELIGYAVAPTTTTKVGAWFAADGYGSSEGSARVGATLYSPSLGEVLALLGVTLVIPSFVFVVSVVRHAVGPLRRRVLILESLGAPSRSLQRALSLKILKVMSRGIAVAAIVGVFVCAFGFRVPYVDFYLNSAYLRRELPVILGGFAIAAIVLVGTTAVLCYPAPLARRGRRNPRMAWNTIRRRATGPAAVISVFAIGMAYQAASNTSLDSATWFLVSVASTLVAVPLVVDYLRPSISRMCVWIAVTSSKPAWLVAGRRLQTDQGGARYASATALLILIVAQAFVFQFASQESTRASVAVRAAIGDEITMVSLPRVETFEEAVGLLPEITDVDAVVVSVGVIATEPEMPLVIRVTGPLEALRAFGIIQAGRVDVSSLPEPSRALFSWLAPARDVEAVVSSLSEATTPPGSDSFGGVMLVASPPGSAEIVELADEMASRTAPPSRPEIPGDEWVAGANLDEALSRWFTLLGVVAALLLSCALLIRQSTSMEISIARTVPLAGALGKPALSGKVVAIQTLVMAVTGSVVGGMAGVATGTLINTGGGPGPQPPYATISAMIAMCLICALVAVAGYWIEGRKRAHEWNPSRSTWRANDE